MGESVLRSSKVKMTHGGMVNHRAVIISVTLAR